MVTNEELERICLEFSTPSEILCENKIDTGIARFGKRGFKLRVPYEISRLGVALLECLPDETYLRRNHRLNNDWVNDIIRDYVISKIRSVASCTGPMVVLDTLKLRPCTSYRRKRITHFDARGFAYWMEFSLSGGTREFFYL